MTLCIYLRRTTFHRHRLVYFVHSYRVKPNSNDVITAESDYGIKVPAVVEYENFFGTQFHPEKSGKVGNIMIKNFLEECKK